MDLAFFLAVVAGAVLATVIALATALLLAPPRRDEATPPERPSVAAFLFHDQYLLDASPVGRQFLEQLRGATDWNRLISWGEPRFPGLEGRLFALRPGGTLDEARGSARIEARAEPDHLYVRITTDLAPASPDALSLRAMEEELALLRSTLDTTPWPIWRRDRSGQITWANPAYLALAGSDPEDLVWPLPDVFTSRPRSGVTCATSGTIRHHLPARNGVEESWFDCVLHPEQEGILGFALPADTLVRTERKLRGSQQALSDTFMGLPIGLAVFDRSRRLQVFNPALADLTMLGVDFLTAQPSLFAFLDRLREKRMIPERRDYASWRQRMVELEKAAAAGDYEETWSLATGQTYRVTGRPHPEGALSLLIEDITSEIALTRRFRAEIELAQEVIDGVPDALAVFSAAGLQLVSNRGYASLWGAAPCDTLAPIDLGTVLAQWEAACLPTPVWQRIRNAIGRLDARQGWTAGVIHADGRRFDCTLTPLADGATLVAFRLSHQSAHQRDSLLAAE